MELILVVGAAALVLVLWLVTRGTLKIDPLAPVPERPAPDELRAQWEAILDQDDVLILDTETTGLGARAEIVEIVMLDTTGAIRFEALSMPVGRIPREASDIHGLTRAALQREGARPWPEIHPDVVSVLSGAAIVVAWNAPYDSRLLSQAAERHNLLVPDLPWLDLLADYRIIRPGGRHRLTDAADRESVSPGTAHRALGDCRTVLSVMRAVAGRRDAHG